MSCWRSGAGGTDRERAGARETRHGCEEEVETGGGSRRAGGRGRARTAPATAPSPTEGPTNPEEGKAFPVSEWEGRGGGRCEDEAQAGGSDGDE